MDQAELLPITTNGCTRCGHQAAIPQQSTTYRYCECICERNHLGAYRFTSDIGTPGQPHLHRTCVRCGYEWLTVTSGGEVQAPPQDPRQVALDIVRGLATELTAAGDALDAAAHVLKDAERGHAAGVAREAGKKAKAHAQSLMPTRS